MQGRAGEVMGATLCSMWVNIDWSEFKVEQDSFLEKAFADGVFTVEDRHLPGIFPTGVRTGGGNIGHTFGVKGTNEEDLTRGMVQGRNMLPEYIRYYQEYVGGAFAEAYPVATGNVLGIRESRRILGDYILKKEDYFARAIFDDEIGRYSYAIDLHESDSSKEAHESFRNQFYGKGYDCGDSYGIPYRCLIPKTLENVYMAGRCISTDRAMLASTRVMPCCFITGQAAGVAAALCVKQGCNNRELNVTLLQERLKEIGAYLPNFQKSV